MTPQYMSEPDAAAANALSISLVLDLRGPAYESSGPLPGTDGVRLALSPSSVQRSDEEADRFRSAPPEDALPELLDTYASQFASGLLAMAERPAANVLFHCRLGKDRTGVFAALLLKLLGVSDDDVLRDYMLTSEYEPLARQLLDEVEAGEAASRREPRVAKEPPSRLAMQRVLERIEGEYGGAFGYFREHGVSPEMLSAFVGSRLECR
jgi:protein-tyrosine phosphatase